MDEKDCMMLRALKECGNITQASAQLFISQPALSKRLKLLESEFGTRLVLRTHNGVQFTTAGDLLARCADDILLRLQETRTAIDRQNESHRMLHIGVPRMFSQYQMPALLQAFSERCPDISPFTLSGFSADILKWLRGREVQVAFVRGDISIPGYESHLVSSDPICLISSRPTRLDQLSRLPRISYQTDPSLQHWFNLWWKQHYPSTPSVTGMQVGDSQTCVQLVEQGSGYAIVPLYVVSEPMRRALYISPLRSETGALYLRSTSLFYPADTTSDAVRRFVAFVKDYFPSPEMGDLPFDDAE